MKALALAAITLVCLLLASCVTSPPKRLDNICHIFEEKRRWYKYAKQAEQRWGSPIATMMAIMHQESRFQAKAKPPRTRILWVIPGPRKSNAYGYSQALDSTWNWYRKSTGRRGADRDNFRDAIDFIGWYNAQTKAKNGVRLNDTRRLYFAYHEGHAGYSRQTYKNKAWLVAVAAKVNRRAAQYQKQLRACQS